MILRLSTANLEYMAHRHFDFPMPARPEVAFDAFHYHRWRLRWDSLVASTQVESGAECPYVGAVTVNHGAGGLRALSMRTRFVSFDRPHVAAATMVGASFPFRRWAASLQHRAASEGTSVLVYTYTFEVGPPALRWLLEPLVTLIFDRETRKRFERLRRFLAAHAHDIEAWQAENAS